MMTMLVWGQSISCCDCCSEVSNR